MPYFIKNGDLNYSEFVEAIKKINSATSITGIDYTDIQVVGDKVVGTRASTNNHFSISLKDFTKLTATYLFLQQQTLNLM